MRRWRLLALRFDHAGHLLPLTLQHLSCSLHSDHPRPGDAGEECESPDGALRGMETGRDRGKEGETETETLWVCHGLVKPQSPPQGHTS